MQGFLNIINLNSCIMTASKREKHISRWTICVSCWIILRSESQGNGWIEKAYLRGQLRRVLDVYSETWPVLVNFSVYNLYKRIPMGQKPYHLTSLKNNNLTCLKLFMYIVISWQTPPHYRTRVSEGALLLCCPGYDFDPSERARSKCVN